MSYFIRNFFFTPQVKEEYNDQVKMQNDITTMEENTEIPQKLNMTFSIQYSNYTTKDTLKKTKTQTWTDSLYTHIHSSNVHNS